MNRKYLLLATLLVAGCASSPQQSDARAKAGANTPAATQSVEDRIASAAETAAKSLYELRLVEVAGSPSKSAPSNRVPTGLGRKLNATFSGPVDVFLKNVAGYAEGYKLVVRGKEPSVPVIVNIDAKATTLYELVRNAAVQAGVRANIIIDASNPEARLLVLEYPA